MKKTTSAKAIMTTLLSTTLVGGSVSAMGASEYIKCYGIAQKGKNDCGNSVHACAGQATQSNQPNEWVYAKQSDCVKKGGSVNKPKES